MEIAVRIVTAFIAIALLPATAQVTQQAPPPSEATNALTASINAMGNVPQDSVATGTVTITSGSKTESGTIRITTRGLKESREEIDLPSGKQQSVYSNGQASENLNGGKLEKSAELAATAQSAIFPLPLMASKFAAADGSFTLVGTETVSGIQTKHLRIANTYLSRPKSPHLAAFSEMNVWIDSATNLPIKITYQRRTCAGACAALDIELRFSDYRNIKGILYPFHIQKLVNGVLWADIRIQDVQFNTALTSADFQPEAL
jgi:outer membrane lipoprotein-sorting protein